MMAAGPLGDGVGHRRGIDQVVGPSQSTKTGRGAGAGDRSGAGDERVGRHDHLVARADAGGPQGQLQGLGAVGDADGVAGAR